MRLGNRQLKTLRSLSVVGAIIVGDREIRRLRDMGLLNAAGDDSFFHITPNGLRALADAADAGRIELFKMPVRQDQGEERT